LTNTTSIAQSRVAAKIITSPADRDRARVAGDRDLPGDKQPDRGEVRPREPLAEQRHGEQGDPDHERLVDERGLRRGRAR
jgi:hypothetical protein